MALPRTLKNFNLFNDANSYMGQVEDVKLPKLARKMNDFRGGGMNGPVEIDQGQDKLELEFTVAGLAVDVFSQYAKSKPDSVMVRFAGAYQDESTGTVVAVEVVVRGRHKEIDPGDAKAGERGKTTVKMPLAYYKLSIDGKERIEIDLLNMIEKVDGSDMLEAQRKAIGIA